jgi:hypothetical protein
MKTTPHEYFSEDPQGIRYQEVANPWISGAIVLCGFGLLLFTAAFLFEVWSWPWHGGKVAGLLTLLVFAGLSISGGLLGLAGMRPQHLLFDAETRRVHGHVRGRLWMLRPIDTGFNSLQQPIIRSIEREMDSDLHEIRIERAGHLPLVLGSYEKRSDAEYWRTRLDRLLKT